jgi:hypothetical protein
VDEPTCAIAGCGKPVEARGWCAMHYMRWWKHGDPLFAKMFFGTAEDRFWHYVDRRGPDECWPWTGTITSQGYGQMWDGKGAVAAHIFAYRIAGKIVPDGLELDHTCHVPAFCIPGKSCPHRRCCNPVHLEAVTPAVNTLRSGAPSALNARKIACSRRGHPYDETNTAWSLRRNRNGTPYWARRCRACAREDASRAWYARKAKRAA